jgi:hypothetical protein
MPANFISQLPLEKIERHARRAAFALLSAFILASLVSFVYIERHLKSAVVGADAEWRANSSLHERVWTELLQPCNEKGQQGILTRDGCEAWAVAEARRRWARDIAEDLRDLRRTEYLAAIVAISKIPAPLSWSAEWLARLFPSLISPSAE